MVTTYPNGMVVDERGNIEIGDFKPRIFRPYLFSDTTPSPEALIQSNTVKGYSLTYLQGQITLTGFPLKIATSPSDNRAQSLQLIAAPETDLSTLIQIWE